MNFDLRQLVMTIETYFFYLVVLSMPVFAAVSIFNRMRVRGVRLVVQNGLLWGFPLLPVIYAAVMLLFTGIGVAMGEIEPVIKFSIYFAASIFWFVGATLAEQRLVVGDGLLLSINAPGRSLLRWNAVTDYFSKPKKHSTEYTFFIMAAGVKGNTNTVAAATRSKVIIRVPNRQRAAFEAIIKERLEHRFEVDPVKIFRSEFKQ
ncbi:MAG: hypothetical protein IAF08_04590 [Rhizobacter sp.]|nr:hypothetical protein [Chlorobiales bacterium]